MTAVAPPLTFQPGSRIGWGNNAGSGFGMNHDEAGTSGVGQRMFGAAGTRKGPTRSNSSSSIASTNSSTSTVSAASTGAQSNGSSATSTSEAGSWAARKKAGSRALWPPGKAEPATGLSTARPQAVNSVNQGPTASSAISALHGPLLPSQQMANGNASQANGAIRSQAQGQPAEPPAILHLLPMNGTFERKTITVPFYPEVLRIGRQTNQKTIPTPLNGYFDSKVLSRQHAEVYADRQGRIFIRDVKSSNGTFVNGMRLSQENKESEPRELREQDVLELGIDIVSEDQKTVVHHKVAAKVEHAGIYGQAQGDRLDFGDLDPSAGAGPIMGQQQLKRAGSQTSMNGRAPLTNPAALGGMVSQPQQMRNWLNPITTEHIVKRLNAEMKMAMQQSQDLARARQAIENMLAGNATSKDSKGSSEKPKPSPTKSKPDIKSIAFSEPPAPPPQAPLPEKPDASRTLADPNLQPLLRRSDTARPPSSSSSPTRLDHAGDVHILRLCRELEQAKGELSNQSEKLKNLETELAQERTARESAEERAQLLEQKDSPQGRGGTILPNGQASSEEQKEADASVPEMQGHLDRLRATMDEMKQQMAAYRQRALSAEAERDQARQSLAEMVEQKRKENAASEALRTPPKSPKSPRRSSPQADGTATVEANGAPVSPASSNSPTSLTLLERAGVQEGEPITEEQAKIMTQLLAQEVLKPDRQKVDGPLLYHGLPLASALTMVLAGTVLMAWMNGWNKVER